VQLRYYGRKSAIQAHHQWEVMRLENRCEARGRPDRIQSCEGAVSKIDITEAPRIVIVNCSYFCTLKRALHVADADNDDSRSSRRSRRRGMACDKDLRMEQCKPRPLCTPQLVPDGGCALRARISVGFWNGCFVSLPYTEATNELGWRGWREVEGNEPSNSFFHAWRDIQRLFGMI
jgi:hypothetical protein